MFTTEQINALEMALDTARVSKRKAGFGNKMLDYLEGWDVIDTANTIFGYGLWHQDVVSIEEIEKREDEGYWHVAYRCLVTITVADEEGQTSSHTDIGFGNGKSKRYFDAAELAGKEAVTDAMKRCFRAYGNQFGNCLYDKERRGTSETEPAKKGESQAATPPEKHTKGKVYTWDTRPNGAVRINKESFMMVGDIESVEACESAIEYNKKLLKWYEDNDNKRSADYAKKDLEKLERKLGFLKENKEEDEAPF